MGLIIGLAPPNVSKLTEFSWWFPNDPEQNWAPQTRYLKKKWSNSTLACVLGYTWIALLHLPPIMYPQPPPTPPPRFTAGGGLCFIYLRRDVFSIVSPFVDTVGTTNWVKILGAGQSIVLSVVTPLASGNTRIVGSSFIIWRSRLITR